MELEKNTGLFLNLNFFMTQTLLTPNKDGDTLVNFVLSLRQEPNNFQFL